MNIGICRAGIVCLIVACPIATAPFAWGQQVGQQAQPPRPPRAGTVAFHGGGSHLGVGVAEIDSERAKALNLKEERGVEVKSVEENSPAAKAGLKEGDAVLDYNGQRVEGVNQFIRMVSETPAGRKASILISRNGATQTLSATLDQGSGRNAFPFSMEMSIPPIPPISVRIPDLPRSLMSWQSSALGIESESLTAQLAEFFGVREGVLVRSVQKDSAGEKAGLKAGDVIVRVDANKVASPREISAMLRSSRSKKILPMTLMRNHKEVNVEVKLDDVSKWPGGGDHAVL